MNLFETELFIDGKRLSISINQPKNSLQWVLFLFGGSKSRGKERFAEWQEFLATENIGSMSFDYSGTGKSTGKFSDSSLGKRIHESIAVIDWLTNIIGEDANLALAGGSMGAYVALGASKIFPTLIKNLILFCPAAYAKECHSLHFGRKFTRCIRRPDSWKNSLAFRWIERFTGRILLLVPENDEVIPSEIPREYQRRAIRATRVAYITIPRTTHNLLSPQITSRRIRQQIYRYSVEFIIRNHGD